MHHLGTQWRCQCNGCFGGRYEGLAKKGGLMMRMMTKTEWSPAPATPTVPSIIMPWCWSSQFSSSWSLSWSSPPSRWKNHHHLGNPPPKKLTWQWKIHHLKMYFLLKMGIFQCHVSFQGCKSTVRGFLWKKRFATCLWSDSSALMGNHLLGRPSAVWSF